MGFPFLALGTLAAGIAGAAISNRGQRQTNQVNTANAIRQQQMAQNWNLEQWHRQNRYNTPAAQMARFKQAGLNPNLIYGQGSPGNAGAVAPAKSGYAEQKNPLASWQNFGMVASQAAQTVNIQKQGQLLEAQALKEASQAAYTTEQKKYVGAQATAAVNKMEAETSNIRMMEGLNEQKKIGQQVENELKRKVQPWQIKKWKTEVGIAMAKKTSAEKEAKIDEIKHDIINSLSGAAKMLINDPAKLSALMFEWAYEWIHKF